MSTDYKKGKSKNFSGKINEINSLSKSKEGKSKKRENPTIKGEEEDSKVDEKDKEQNYRYKTDTRGRYNNNMRRVDKVKIMVRKEMANEPKKKTDEDKNKKKEIKKADSISSWSVESVEVIKENGVFKKEDKDLQDKIEKSMLNQKEKKKKNGEDDDDNDEENKEDTKNKDKKKDGEKDKDKKGKDKDKNKESE